ncbi:MAG TPA: hypothetical protein VGM05_13085 [Planctomycetaceae bacterium]|jgi:hypothetical protein
MTAPADDDEVEMFRLLVSRVAGEISPEQLVTMGSRAGLSREQIESVAHELATSAAPVDATETESPYETLIRGLVDGGVFTADEIESTCKAAGKSRKQLRVDLGDYVLNRQLHL